jgi:RNA polymerase sigma factor (sigma-70 family)
MTNTELRKIEREKLHQLSNEEKIDLFINGEFDKLVKCHYLYLVKIAKETTRNPELIKEHFSILLEGLLNGLNSFDKDKSPYITQYLIKCAKNKLNQHFLSLKMKKRNAATVNYDDVSYDISQEEETMSQEEINNILDNIFTFLNYKEQKLISYVRDGLNNREIAEHYGVSHQAISLKLIKLMKKIKHITKKLDIQYG